MSGRDEAQAAGTLNGMTPEQCRAARGLLDWSANRLAEQAGLEARVVEGFEGRTADTPSGTLEILRSALTRAGVVFEDAGRPGVSLGSRGADEGTRLGALTTENDH